MNPRPCTTRYLVRGIQQCIEVRGIQQCIEVRGIQQCIENEQGFHKLSGCRIFGQGTGYPVEISWLKLKIKQGKATKPGTTVREEFRGCCTALLHSSSVVAFLNSFGVSEPTSFLISCGRRLLQFATCYNTAIFYLVRQRQLHFFHRTSYSSLKGEAQLLTDQFLDSGP